MINDYYKTMLKRSSFLYNVSGIQYAIGNGVISQNNTLESVGCWNFFQKSVEELRQMDTSKLTVKDAEIQRLIYYFRRTATCAEHFTTQCLGNVNIELDEFVKGLNEQEEADLREQYEVFDKCYWLYQGKFL